MALDQDALARLRKGLTGGAGRQGRSRLGRIALFIAIAAGSSFVWLGRGEGALEVDVVTAEAPDAGTGGAVLNASGYVVARRLATVSSKATGRVMEVLFEEGAEVRAGQVLARLDDATVRAQREVSYRQRDAAQRALAEIEVRLADARRSRDRMRTLQADKLVSQSSLDAAEAEAEALAARLASARAELAVASSNVALRDRDLEDFVIRAPFSGVIISKDAQPGEMISPVSAGGGFTRTGIATIVDMDSREVEVDVNEAYINRVAAGQRAEAVLDAYSDWKIPARVTAIVPTADRQKATVRVRIGFEKLDPRILPDMGVKVRFFDEAATTRAARSVSSVTGSAVHEEDGKLYVWRVDDERAHKVIIEAGEEAGGRRDVLAGLKPGDSVVAGSPEGIAEGRRLQPRKGT